MRALVRLDLQGSRVGVVGVEVEEAMMTMLQRPNTYTAMHIHYTYIHVWYIYTYYI